MWRKIALGIGAFILLAFVAAYIFVPRIAESKLRKFLTNADSASFTTLDIHFWEGNAELRNVYVLDTSGNLANQPVKLVLDLISIRGFNILHLLKENIAEADSIIIGKGSITIPLFHKDSKRLAPKGDAKFLQQFNVKHLFLDSLRVDLSLHPRVKSQRIRGTVIFKADDVSIPFVKNAQLSWTGSLALQALSINDSLGKLTKMPLWLELSSLRLTGLDANDLTANRVAKADSLLVGKGRISLVRPERNDSISTNNLNSSQLLINNIGLNFFKADSLAFTLDLNPNNLNEKFKTTLICQVSDVIIPLKEDAPLSYNNLQIALKDIYLRPHKSIAYYTAHSCRYNSLENSMVVQGFKLNQSIAQGHYAKHFGWDKTFIKLDVFELLIEGIPTKLEKLSDGINLDKITVQGAQAYFYKNKRLPHSNKAKPFPIEALSALKIPVSVNTIVLNKGQILYRENRRTDQVPGRLNVNNINVTISNISSSGPTKAGEWTVIKGNALLLNKLALAIDWSFDLRTKGKHFTLDLSIGNCPLNALNPYTENTYGFRFKKGSLHGGRLLVSGSKKIGTGTLDLFYENMKIELLDKQTHQIGIVEWAGGGFANLLVRNTNLEYSNPKQGIVYAAPIASKSISAFVAKMLLSGFKDIAVGSKNQQKVKQDKNPKLALTKRN